MIEDDELTTSRNRPQGVGMGMKPQQWLKDGDEVEIALEGVGSILNKVVFEKDEKARL